jgi:hypothetical protein
MAGDIHFDGGDDLEKELESVGKRGGPQTGSIGEVVGSGKNRLNPARDWVPRSQINQPGIIAMTERRDSTRLNPAQIRRMKWKLKVSVISELKRFPKVLVSGVFVGRKAKAEPLDLGRGSFL